MPSALTLPNSSRRVGKKNRRKHGSKKKNGWSRPHQNGEMEYGFGIPRGVRTYRARQARNGQDLKGVWRAPKSKNYRIVLIVLGMPALDVSDEVHFQTVKGVLNRLRCSKFKLYEIHQSNLNAVPWDYWI